MLHAKLHTLALVLTVGSPVAEPSLTSDPAPEPPLTIEPGDISEPAPEPLTIRLDIELSELPAPDTTRLSREIQEAIDPRLAAELHRREAASPISRAARFDTHRPTSTSIGGALLATDVTALRKRRARRLAVHPSLTTTHGAIVIHGRF